MDISKNSRKSGTGVHLVVSGESFACASETRGHRRKKEKYFHLHRYVDKVFQSFSLLVVVNSKLN